jgi:hypothetical protein
MKAIFKRPRQDLSVKVYRYELPLGIIKILISRHPVLPKRSPLSLPLPIWQFYHIFKTFSTASTPRITGSKKQSEERVPLFAVRVHAMVMSNF